MSCSYAELQSLVCPTCGATFEAEVWLILHAGERPDLLARVVELHDCVCSECQITCIVDAPLLIFRPESEPLLIFSPAEGTTTDDDRHAAARSVAWLGFQLGSAWQDAWLERVVWVPRARLKEMLKGDRPRADTQHSADLQQPPLLQLVIDFVMASSWSESLAIVRERPEIVSTEADEILTVLRDQLRWDGGPGESEKCEEHRILLKRCQEIGIESAFGEKMGLVEAETMDSLPLEVLRDIGHAREGERRFRADQDLFALDDAAAAWARVLSSPALLQIEIAERLRILNDAGLVFWLRYGVRRHLSDLESALALWAEAAQAATADSPSLHMYLLNLGIGLHERYDRFGRIEDLDAEIDAFDRAVQATPNDSADRPKYLGNQGNGLSVRYAHTGHEEDLERAIEAYKQAVRLTPIDSLDLALRLNNLGTGLRTRYERTGCKEDLDAAMDSFERAVQAAPKNSPHLATHLNNLGTGLTLRYQRTGHKEDLEATIVVFWQAVQAAPKDAPNLAAILTCLGTSLSMRSARKGSIEDLDAAIECYERAANAASDDSSHLLICLNNLGGGLRDRYVRCGRLEDLESALNAFERLVQLTPADSPLLPARHSNLGNCLCNRFAHSGRLEDLEAALEAHKFAVKATAEDSPALSGYLTNLGAALSTRYAHFRRIDDLEMAIEVYKRAVQTTPDDSPELPALLNNLATGFRARYERTSNFEDLAAALAIYQRACVGGLDLAPEAAVIASGNWSVWALERGAWDESTKAADYGIGAAEQVHRVSLLRTSKESWMRKVQGLYPRSAYALARTGDLKGALLAAEMGRARLLTEVMDRDRANLETARIGEPAAVERYEAAAAQLQRMESTDRTVVAVAGDDPRPLRDQIREARAALDDAITAIRALPGQASFLAPSKVSDLERTLEDGIPAVYFAVTEVGTVALIALREGAETRVEPVWANSMTDGRLRELLVGPADAPAQAGWVGAWNRIQMERMDAAHQHWLDVLSETTRQLWELLMSPVVGRLEALGVKEAVLIPSGLLGLLPLHAAWTDSPSPRAALDAVAFRYAPSLRALDHAHRLAGGAASDSLLSVREPKPVSACDLPFTAIEEKSIVSLFARQASLAHQQATRLAVLDALHSADIAHFSCHGGTDWQSPLQSGLLLAYNERLTVQDLFSLHLPGARMAVLSACETAVPGTELPDEVVALPAAFLQAGFAGVVASLWSVNDLSTALLMIRFYELWRQDGLRPAVALQRAQIWMRDTTNAEKQAHFDRQIPAGHGLRLPAAAAAATLMETEMNFVLHRRDPKARDFAHPVWWAAFTLTGV